MNLRLLASKILPVRFCSTYWSKDGRERATWWQFRGRVFRHRRIVRPA